MIKSYRNAQNYITIPFVDLDQDTMEALEVVDTLIGIYAHEVYLCGGAASWALGVTNKYSDFDLYCKTATSFVGIKNQVEILEEKLQGNVLKCRYGKIKIDIINVQMFSVYRIQLEDILETFDHNWCMAGIHFGSRQLIYHEDAKLSYPIHNTDARHPYKSSIKCRVLKYSDRLCTQVDKNKLDNFIDYLDDEQIT